LKKISELWEKSLFSQAIPEPMDIEKIQD
jgi:hypothetical protein